MSLVVGSLAVSAVAVEANGSEIIFFGGPILTMESDTPIVQAVAIADGRIVAVGDRGTVFRWRSEGTQLINLDGKTLLPGFHNPHVHPTMAAVTMGWEDVSGYSHPTVEASWQALRMTFATARTSPSRSSAKSNSCVPPLLVMSPPVNEASILRREKPGYSNTLWVQYGSGNSSS